MTDSYGRVINYLRLSVTDLCNLRCRYCMPAEGICKKNHTDMLTEDEMIAAVKAAASLGINKLRITGGEPLVKKNILSICERSASVEGIAELCLTTNGILLTELARNLREVGVNRLNISLDTLNPEKYSYITRNGSLKSVLKGIEAAVNAGFDKIKINSVLIGGFNDDEIKEISELTLKLPVDVRFIELMPMTEIEGLGNSAYTSGAKVLAALPELSPAVQDGSTAQLYRLPNSLGNIGLIRALSTPFCITCNRIRLTADGKLKPCLHSNQEFNIKGLDIDGMRQEFISAISAKPFSHAPLSASERSSAHRNMNQIGG